ncbi:sugar transporter [Pseudohyphozyma bogoriensis]|nr:sugar transporter [Pseudohyphozyma bogoriensis]
MTFSWLQFGVILFAAVGSLTYGYAAGVISTTLGQPTFLEYFALDTRPDSTAYTSALVVGFQCGGFIGALASPYFADRWGRKLVLYVSAAGVIALAAIQAGSISLKMFLVARTLGGLPVGGILVAVPLYQAEIAPAKLRGQLMAMHGMMLALGYVISSWLSLAFYYVPNSSVSWRVPLALQAVFPAVLVVGLTWLPESPRWLISKDKGSQAQKILDLLHQDPDAVDPLHTSHYEFKAIVEQNELEKTRDVSWGAILRTPSYRKRAILAFLSLFIYPSTGTLTITNYLPSLLAKLGFGASQQLALAGGYITYAPLGNVVASYLLDRFGRKRMFFIGLTGCVLALTGETIVIAKGLDTKAGQGIGVFFFFMHLVFFATFLDSTTFLTLGIDKFFLLGTSQGGFIACRVAIRGGDRVQGIIACGSTFEAEVTYNEFFQELMDEFATEKDDFVVSEEYRKWYIHMGWGDTVGPDLEKFWRDTLDVRFSGREGQRRLWQITTNLAERDSIRNRVQEIRCPVYILHGSEDVAIPVDLIKTHFGWLTRSSHKEMHVIHGGTHYLTQSSPKEVKSFIVKLLK